MTHTKDIKRYHRCSIKPQGVKMNSDIDEISSLQNAISSQEIVLLSCDDSPKVFQSKVISTEGNRCTILNTVPYQLISDILESNHYELQIGSQRFHADKILSDGINIIFPIVSVSSISNTRQEHRRYFSYKDKAICKFTNPYDKETQIEKKMIDLSSSGMSFESKYKTKLLTVGTLISSFKIVDQDQEKEIGAGKIVYTRELIDIKKNQLIQVGVSFI